MSWSKWSTDARAVPIMIWISVLLLSTNLHRNPKEGTHLLPLPQLTSQGRYYLGMGFLACEFGFVGDHTVPRLVN